MIRDGNFVKSHSLNFYPFKTSVGCWLTDQFCLSKCSAKEHFPYIFVSPFSIWGFENLKRPEWFCSTQFITDICGFQSPIYTTVDNVLKKEPPNRPISVSIWKINLKLICFVVTSEIHCLIVFVLNSHHYDSILGP